MLHTLPRHHQKAIQCSHFFFVSLPPVIITLCADITLQRLWVKKKCLGSGTEGQHCLGAVSREEVRNWRWSAYKYYSHYFCSSSVLAYSCHCFLKFSTAVLPLKSLLLICVLWCITPKMDLMILFNNKIVRRSSGELIAQS